jgi:hypothetical protein
VRLGAIPVRGTGGATIGAEAVGKGRL